MSSNFGRRTWNKEDYISDKSSTRNENEHLESLSDEQLRLLKLKYTDYNQLMKDSTKGLNQRILFSNVSQYKKGKQFGFYCDICNLTFKDTLQFVDHLNSKPHQIRFQTVFHEDLILNKRDNDDISLSEFCTTYNNIIKQFVKKNRISNKDNILDTKTTNKIKKKKVETGKDTPINSEMSKILGFSNFGSTKK